MRHSRSCRISAFLPVILVLVLVTSCTSLPKLATLQPIPEYPEDRGGWDTSGRCVLVSESAYVPMEKIMGALRDAEYTICRAPDGYLTREARISVDKAVRIEDYAAVSSSFQDGSSTDSSIVVTVHDTEHLKQYGPFSAQARSITQMVDLRKVPGGKELLKEIKSDPSKVAQVPELLGKDPQETKAFMKDKKLYIAEGDVFAMLMENLLCQPEFRKALNKEQ